MKKILLLTSVLISSSALAEPFKGQADLGWLTTSGNSETTSLNAQLKLTKEAEKWLHEAVFTAIGSSNENDGVDETTAEKYTAALKSDRKLDDRSYLYALANYTDDRFSGFDFQANAGFGYGYKVIAEEDKTLQLEVGPGYSFNRYSTIPASGDREIEEVTYRIGEKFTWNFSETSELSQYLAYEAGSDLKTLTYGGYVSSKLAAALALKIGIDVTNRDSDDIDNDPTIDDTDTTTYANLSYSF